MKLGPINAKRLYEVCVQQPRNTLLGNPKNSVSRLHNGSGQSEGINGRWVQIE